jgi:DNA primase (bacterial type)
MIRRWLPKEEIERANSVNMAELASKMGYQVNHKGSSRFEIPGVGGFEINGNMWYSFAQSRGGGPIQFAMSWPNHGQRDFQDAVIVINQLMYGNSIVMDVSPYEQGRFSTSARPVRGEDFELPTRASDNARVFAYLTRTRGIEPTVVRHCFDNNSLYQSAGYGNCVFLGFDEGNTPRYAHLRDSSTEGRFRQDARGSQKKYGFTVEPHPLKWDKGLIVFEAPIDLLSEASIDFWERGEQWRDIARIALGGTSDDALLEYLSRHPDVETVTLALDNDIAGIQATERIIQMMVEKFPNIQLAKAEFLGKDYNEYLKFLEAEGRSLDVNTGRSRTQAGID